MGCAKFGRRKVIDSLEEKRRFASLMTALADYYEKSLSKGVIALYWDGLRQYDYEAIEKAAWAHTQLPDEAGRWMPKVSDLNKMLAGRTSDQGQIAWSKVDWTVRTVGPYADVAFDDPLIHRVIQEMGGWVHLCGKDEKEWPFTAKEFITRYQSYKMTGETPEHAPYLTGIASSQNQSAGHVNKLEVRLIGNAKKAREVIKGAETLAIQGEKE
jgi:hypothetical protein